VFVDEAKIFVKAGDAAMAAWHSPARKIRAPRRVPPAAGWRSWRQHLSRSQSERQHAAPLPLQSRIQGRSRPARRRLQLHRPFWRGHDPAGSRRHAGVRRPRATIADLAAPGRRVLIAHGGRGGRGQSTLCQAWHQAPREHEDGFPGEERYLRLELKLLADVGLVGYPNAGKSTLISVISAARRKSPTTPLPRWSPISASSTPTAGTGGHGTELGRTFVVADLPGLIEARI